MTQRKLVLSYDREGGSKGAIHSEDLASYLKEAERFLADGYEFRAIVKHDDTEAQTQLTELFKKHASKYTVEDTSKSPAGQAALGAVIATGESLAATAATVAGLTTVEVALDGLGDLAHLLGEHVTDTIAEHALEHAASALHSASEMAGHAIDKVVENVFPAGLAVKIIVKSYILWKKTKRKNESAVVIITFAKQKTIMPKAEDVKNQLFPALVPIPATVRL